MSRSNITRIVSGLVVIGLGLAFLLDNIGLFEAGYFVSNWWPLLIVLAGALMLAANVRNWLLGTFLIVLGGAYQLRQLDVVAFEPWDLVWPLVVVFVGLALVFRRSYIGEHASKSERDDLTAILSGAKMVNTSKSFKESHATAIMGGAVLDLRKATIEKDALVEVFGFWGGVELVVPKHVIIRSQINNILAGTEDKTAQETDKTSPTLTIAGDLIMAGLVIRNTPSDS